MSVKFAAVLTIAGVLAGGGAFAQEGAIAQPAGPTEVGVPDTYGTATSTSVTISVFDCDTFAQTDAWQPVPGTPNRFLTSGFFECGIQVPSGSQITRVEIEGCDTSATAEINVTLIRTTTTAGGGGVFGTVATGVAAAPGCALTGLNLATPEVVTNGTRKYFLQITTGNTAATQLAAVRVFYRLQVSAAPATATFPNDVPTTHPFFRFVEAMAASGITGGCGTGSFCPDTAVTRGQMAVFLSTALGLHFAP